MTTPESAKLAALLLELDKLIDRVQQLAAETDNHEIALFHLAERLSDAQHSGRRVQRLMEL